MLYKDMNHYQRYECDLRIDNERRKNKKSQLIKVGDFKYKIIMLKHSCFFKVITDILYFIGLKKL